MYREGSTNAGGKSKEVEKRLLIIVTPDLSPGTARFFDHSGTVDKNNIMLELHNVVAA
jgi:hypothetical protein